MSCYSLLILSMLVSCDDNQSPMDTEATILYMMPEESEPHEGTWLQWPHHYQYGLEYRNSLDPTWIALTAALESSERVHIIAYNEIEN